MYKLYCSSLVKRSLMSVILMMSFLVLMVASASAGKLVAEGKRYHYIAHQEEGIIYVVYADGESVRFADGFGYISGLAVSPDNSLYVVSKSQQRVFKVNSDGKVIAARKVSAVPEAVFVDRDGRVKFVQRNGAVTGIR